MSNGHFSSCPGGNCICEERRYWWVLVISLIIASLEFAGSVLSGSLALLSDGFHVLIDGLAAGIAIGISRWIRKQPTAEQRLRSVGGFVHTGLLAVVAGQIIVEALNRFSDNYQITSSVMLAVAVLGAIGNLIQERLLHQADDKNLTWEGMTKHVITDLVQSLIVIAAAAVIYFTDFTLVDPLAAVLIALLMLRWAYKLAGKSYHLAKIK